MPEVTREKAATPDAAKCREFVQSCVPVLLCGRFDPIRREEEINRLTAELMTLVGESSDDGEPVTEDVREAAETMMKIATRTDKAIPIGAVMQVFQSVLNKGEILARDVLSRTKTKQVRHKGKHDGLRSIVERLLQWDHFDTAADGAYWRRELSAALGIPTDAARQQLDRTRNNAMSTLKQAVDDVFVMDYDNIPGKGPKMLFRKLDDGTMSLAMPEHVVEFVQKQFGVSDPVAFMEAVRELVDSLYCKSIPQWPEIEMAKDRLAAMLPENADAK